MKQLKHLAILLIATLLASAATAQTATRSVGLHLQKAGITISAVDSYIDRTFGDGGTYIFKVINSYTDSYGTTHTDYQQYYRGVPVENCILIVHSEGNIVVGINGQAATAAQMQASTESITAAQAAANARTAMGVSSSVNPIIDKVYTRYRDTNGNEQYRLAYRTRLASFADGKNVNTYIDCSNGSVIKTENLMLYADNIIEREIDPLYPTAEGFEHVKRNIRMTESDGVYSLTDAERNIYIHQGKTTATKAPTTDAEMVEHITKINKETPYRTSKQADKWNMYHLTDVTIDSIDSHRFIGKDSLFTWLDTASAGYYITICQEEQEVYSSKAENKVISGIPPLELNDKFVALSPNTTYTLYIKRRYDKPPHYIFEALDTVCAYNFTPAQTGIIPFDNDSVFGTYTLTSRPDHAIDVQYAMHASYEYYLERHGRKGFDGKNTPLHVFVDFNDIYFGKTGMQAFAWSSAPYFIATGSGDGHETTDVYASLDLLAHEYTHLVVMTNGRGGLKTTGEPGALNEAIPDCFAVAVDMHSNGNRANWQIAEDGVLLQTANMRDLANPKMSGGGESTTVARPLPDTYGGEYWKDPSDLGADAGGIHFNNSVFNYWFYLITEGGEGTNDNNVQYSVKGLGIEQSEKLLMDVVLNYMVPEASFSDMYNATRLAAEQHFGGTDGETYKQVTAAWQAVGVNATTSDIDPVTSAELNVYTSGNNIMVETEKDAEISIYSVLGQIITTARAQEGTTTIAMPEIGNQVVIVKVGSQAKKVLVK